MNIKQIVFKPLFIILLIFSCTDSNGIEKPNHKRSLESSEDSNKFYKKSKLELSDDTELDIESEILIEQKIQQESEYSEEENKKIIDAKGYEFFKIMYDLIENNKPLNKETQEYLNQLIASGVDINYGNSDEDNIEIARNNGYQDPDYPLLIHAVRHNRKDIVTFLLGYKDVFLWQISNDDNCDSALSLALENDLTDIVQLLLNYDLLQDSNWDNSDGLSFACINILDTGDINNFSQSNSKKKIEYFLKHPNFRINNKIGLEINSEDNDKYYNRTILITITKRLEKANTKEEKQDYIDLARFFIYNGADATINSGYDDDEAPILNPIIASICKEYKESLKPKIALIANCTPLNKDLSNIVCTYSL